METKVIQSEDLIKIQIKETETKISEKTVQLPHFRKYGDDVYYMVVNPSNILSVTNYPFHRAIEQHILPHDDMSDSVECSRKEFFENYNAVRIYLNGLVNGEMDLIEGKEAA